MFAQKYAELVKLTKEAAREVMAPLRAREMKTAALAKQAALASKIVEAEQRVQELVSAYPIDFDKVLGAMDEAALLKRQSDQLDLMIKGLFPEDAA